MSIELKYKDITYLRNTLYYPGDSISTNFFFWTNTKYESVDIDMDKLLEQMYQNELKRIERIKKLKRIL